MRLSPLQRFILISAYGVKGKVARFQFLKYYDKQKKKPNRDDQQRAISKSMVRLVDKALMIGYGRRTPEKWFIESVQLTAAGKRQVKKLFGTQQKLPFIKKGK